MGARRRLETEASASEAAATSLVREGGMLGGRAVMRTVNEQGGDERNVEMASCNFEVDNGK